MGDIKHIKKLPKGITEKFLKECVEDYEYNISGSKYSGSWVEVENFRIRTGELMIEEEDVYIDDKEIDPEALYCIADITIGNNFDRKKEIFYDCFYPVGLLKTRIEAELKRQKEVRK